MFENLTPFSPWLMQWSFVAAVVAGSAVAAIEAFYECKLHRRAPWGNLCSWGAERKGPR
jgi:hypothetical protein